MARHEIARARRPSAGAYLRQRGAAQQAIGRAKSLRYFEMIVVLTQQHLDPFAGGTKGNVEITSLALEFRRLLCAVG
jgi:hypothetical protein